MTKINSKNFAKRPSWSNCALSWKFSSEPKKERKQSVYPVYRTAPSQYKSTTLQQYRQFRLAVVSLRVLCSARIIINDNSRHMSVKRIRLHIKAKRKFHYNLVHKEESTRSLQSQSLFVNRSQILTTRSPPTATFLHRADVKKTDLNCIASNISAVQ